MDYESQPIPTPYRGVVYRSRTEARWARFFGFLEIPFEYETQGFNTDGEWYLPDFLVFGALGMLWVEIKGSWKKDPDGVGKFRRFAVGRPQPSRAALIEGPPALGLRCLVIGGDESLDDPFMGPWEADDHEWRPCQGGYHYDLAYAGTFRAKFAQHPGCPEDFGAGGEERVARAVEAALNERFGGKSAPPGTAA